MSNLLKVAKKFLSQREEGATMIEYGLLAALVSIATVAVLPTVGTQLVTIFNAVVTALTPAA